jgi:serine/threonine protein kinase
MGRNREGMTLGGYRIISQIGKGGMATVYKAWQESMERYVALKVLPKYHSKDPSFTKRFIQEARTIARLEHRNILPVYDYGEQEGVAYMAMRYLKGGTLRDILSTGELPFRDIVDIMGQICAGLGYAHRHGVIHRDIKPSNIMVDTEGAVYITDFGMAKVLENTGTLTASGTMLGTPLYMSPEQCAGKEIDARSDIYAVGVVLYEMVTGQTPYQADTPMAILLAHIHEPLPLPKDINPSIPDDIQRVILKALAKDPEDRYQSVQELSDALTEAAQHVRAKSQSPTLQILATEAEQSIESQSIPPGDERFTPISASFSTSQSTKKPRSARTLAWKLLGAAALTAALLFVGIRYLRGAPASPSEAPPSEPVLYDDFDSASYDGTVNTKIWEIDADDSCQIRQEEGILVVSNEKTDYDLDTCDLLLTNPSTTTFRSIENLQADIFLKGDYQGDEFGESLMYSAEVPEGGYWFALCGPELADEELLAGFWIARVTANGNTLEEYYNSEDILADKWYTYNLKIDTTKGAISCYIDNYLIGTALLENIDELKTLSYERGLTAWRSPGTIAVTQIDNFWVSP